MRGVILAGGKGTRLYPLTKVVNKNLLPIGEHPMIFQSVYKLKKAGITDIMVVSGRDDLGDIITILGSGQEFGVSFTYKAQDYVGGVAHALSLAEDFANGDHIIVLLADNLFQDDLTPYIHNFDFGARIFLSEVDDPNRYGVPTIVDGKITEIIEKPFRPKSNYAVTGIYIYDSNVFSFIDAIEPSDRGEYEITDVNNLYLKYSKLTFTKLNGWWIDAGTHESYQKANQLIKGDK